MRRSLRARSLAAAASIIPITIASQVAIAQDAGSSSSASQPAAQEAIETVIVTANKREENIQDVPMAISAISGQQLEGTGPASIASIALTTPSLTFSTLQGYAQISIRGIGTESLNTGFEGRVATHLDGVYLAGQRTISGALFDLDRIEVLNGPQGDLYGRNATGGAVNIITRKPTFDTDGYVNITMGNYGLVETQGAIGGPLSDTLAGRIAVDVVGRGGFGKNILTGKDVNTLSSRAVRGQLLYRPDERFEVLASFDYFSESDSSATQYYMGAYNYPGNPQGFGVVVTPYAYHPFTADPGALYPNGAPPPYTANYVGSVTNKNDIQGEFQPNYDAKNWGGNLTATYHLADDVTVKSISGYRRSKSLGVIPFQVASPVPDQIYGYPEDLSTWSEEAQIIGDFFDNRLHLITGGYYFDDHVSGGVQVASTPFFMSASPDPLAVGRYDNVQIRGSLHTTSVAGYAHLAYDITDELSLVLGGRYTSDSVTSIRSPLINVVISPTIDTSRTPPFTGFPFIMPGTTTLPSQSTSYNNFSPRATLTYKPDRQTMLYVTYSKGFKSGGYNLGSSQPPFAPEKITDYEGGIKRDWLDGRLRTNLSAFYYDYQNIQVRVSLPIVGGQIRNAAGATVYGLDGFAEALITDQLTANVAFSLLHTAYGNFLFQDPVRPTVGTPETCAAGFCEQQLEGNQFYSAPDYKVSIGADYKTPVLDGGVTLHGDVTFTARTYFSAFDQLNVSAPANALLNASARYDSPRGFWGMFWIKNITDRQVPSMVKVSTIEAGDTLFGSWTPPRTFGATIGYSF